jgi:hypothetical protein
MVSPHSDDRKWFKQQHSWRLGQDRKQITWHGERHGEIAILSSTAWLRTKKRQKPKLLPFSPAMNQSKHFGHSSAISNRESNL